MRLGRRFFPQTLSLALVALAAGPTRAGDDPRVVRVTGFGAEPGSRRNAVAAVARALDACRRVENPVLVFPKGRARGVLVSTPGRVLIERNRFASSGSAVLIAGDANYWYESGAGRDVTIRGNVFAPACLGSPYQFGEGIVSVYPEIPAPDTAFPFHRNIRIEDNEFHPSDYPVLYAKSVRRPVVLRQPPDPQPAPRARPSPEGHADLRVLPARPGGRQPVRARRARAQHRPEGDAGGRAGRRAGPGLGPVAGIAARRS